MNYFIQKAYTNSYISTYSTAIKELFMILLNNFLASGASALSVLHVLPTAQEPIKIMHFADGSPCYK